MQTVHWVCQPDASSQGIETHAEPLTSEVMWVDELLKNEESRALTMGLHATLCQVQEA